MDHVVTRRGALSLVLCGLCSAQRDPAFEVVSFKHTGNLNDGARIEGGTKYYRPIHNLEYRGVRLSGEVPLWSFFQFAFSPLVKPWHLDSTLWVNDEYYQIEAIAPKGTTLDVARAMLRTVLRERLGVEYHLVDRDTPVYFLMRGDKPFRLPPATEPEPNPGAMQMGKYIRKSASLGDFASFLSGLAGRPVSDKTGISGQFRFDVDWSQQLQESMSTFGRGGDPGIALREVKQLGLRLEPGKEATKYLVIDHMNKMPTPN